MDLSFNETQTMLRDSATRFFEAELPKAKVREIDESPSGFATDLWQKISDLGWPGTVIPEQYGGSGNSFTDLGCITEIMGYFACSLPLWDSAVLSAHAILEAGSEEQKSNYLPSIAKGQQIVSFALTEPEYGWSPKSVNLKASEKNGDYILNGTKLFIPWAHIADQILVVARTSRENEPSQGLSLFMVDKNTSGLSVRLQSGWIGDKVCEVKFDNVQVPSSAIIGTIGNAWPYIEKALDRATSVVSPYMAGGSQRAYEMCRDYSTERIAFGVPIGTFQRVQDHIIVALTEAEAAHWTSFEALWRLDSGRDDASIGISMAKAVASEGFPKACDASHNVHAGIGVDLDFGLTHYTVRSRTFQHYLGDAIHHRARMADLMKLSS
jgi:alkylation response protein AidB-like acyl-CoA dehydrogenase